MRRRPGMYIGGTDDTAYHHLASEIIDNAMDEAVAGFADVIEVSLESADTLYVRDNGRGIPVDAHPKFKDRSALEVIFTTLHAGGSFRAKLIRHRGFTWCRLLRRQCAFLLSTSGRHTGPRSLAPGLCAWRPAVSARENWQGARS
ncbi:ATP-binding protein [Sorlinia euscelidii]|uniref:ATP-binding protein n=1 Tax=Sorlinia euscelidii TaxID=3081148 RepID=UPI00374E05E7